MNATYKPEFDTTIRTTTKIEQHRTTHTERMDWSYPFTVEELTRQSCNSDDWNQERFEKVMQWVKQCDQWRDEDVWATNGQTHFKVIGCCIASGWPYWKPRPTIIINGPLGPEFIDWTSLNGVMIRTKPNEPA